MLISAPVLALIDRLSSCGHAAYAVGGCVRDCLMGRAPSDWDITTSARPEQMKACFSDLRTVDTGLRHGTLTVLMDGRPYEVTTFRADGAYTDHRRPDAVRFVGELREDLARRDFTINAMAVGPDGALIDPFSGRADLDNKTVRCVGDPAARFEEDALRILRALRFASTLSFGIEPATAAAMREKKGLLRHVSAERICAEFSRMLCGTGIEKVLLEHADVLAEIIPDIAPAVGFPQHNPHHAHDVWGHTARAVSLIQPVPALRWTMLLHDLGKPLCFTRGADGVGHFYGHAKLSVQIARCALADLRADNRTRDRVLTLIRIHDLRPEPTDRWLSRRLNEHGEALLRDLFAVQRADTGAQSTFKRREKLALLDACEARLDALLRAGACFSLAALAVNGQDMLAIGMPRGKQIGIALNWLLRQVMDGALPNEKGALLAAARALESAEPVRRTDRPSPSS